MKTNIVISPSQQIENKCSVGDSEADHCRLICESVVALLGKYECNAFIVPKMDGIEPEVLEKISNSSNYFCKTNQSDMDFHLDVHTDGGYDGKGTSGFYFSEGGKAFIQKIHREVSLLTPWADGICSLRDLYVLRKTTAIAGLIEISFHDRIKEASWIHANITAVAEAIVRGIVNATEIVPKKISYITNVDLAIKVLLDRGIINDAEFRKKVCDTTKYEDEFVLKVANYIANIKKG